MCSSDLIQQLLCNLLGQLLFLAGKELVVFPQAEGSLFLDLSEEEQKIVSILAKQGSLQINTLVVEADIPVQKMSALLFELEMKGVVRVLAGGMYQLLN